MGPHASPNLDRTYVVWEVEGHDDLAVVRCPNAETAVGRVRTELVRRYGADAASIELRAELVEPGQTRWLE